MHPSLPPSSRALPRLGAALAFLVSSLCGGAAAAADVPPQVAACQACHGRDGVSASESVPNLAGQRAEYLVRQMQAFRSGGRKHDLMTPIAAQLDAAAMQQLAAHWSQQPAGAGRDATPAAHAANVSAMTMPADFPRGYTEYQRSDDAPSKQIGVKYANAVAVAAARAGQPLPDGSAIVQVAYAAELDAGGQPLRDDKGRMKPGRVLSYSGMESRAGWGAAVPELLRNGNWLYGLWTPDGASRLGAQQAACLACHKPKAADSYVFTLGELQRAVR